MIGVVELEEAKRRAAEVGLDLVEIAADSKPPVVRVMDFGKFKYELAKKEKHQKTKSKAGEMKEVRLGRSMKIDPHDVEIRVNQARQFLMEGYRVVFVQNFRGRELAYRSKGDERMGEIAKQLADIGRVEMTPRLNGKRMSMILVPDRAKIESAKQKGGAPKTSKESPAKEKGANERSSTPVSRAATLVAGEPTPGEQAPAAAVAPTASTATRVTAEAN